MVVICSLMPFSYTKEELWALADEARVFLRFGEGERDRINKISKDTSAALSLGGLIALSRAVDKLGIECGELTIHRDGFGKPCFLKDGAPAFSIAHAGKISVAAISSGGVSVGVDIERIDEGRDTLRISEKFFSAAEKEMLSLADDKLFEFYRIWTSKEALMKHGGEGLVSVMSADSAHSECVFSHYPISFENDKYILTLSSDGKEEIVLI